MSDETTPTSEDATPGPDRRTFIKGASGTMLAAGMSACHYSRILGSNNRIRVAQLGCGARSRGHVHMIQLAAKQTPVETVAVCDIWSLAREARAARSKRLSISSRKPTSTPKRCSHARISTL